MQLLPDSDSISLKELSFGSDYQIEVTAVNANGSSLPSRFNFTIGQQPGMWDDHPDSHTLSLSFVVALFGSCAIKMSWCNAQTWLAFSHPHNCWGASRWKWNPPKIITIHVVWKREAKQRKKLVIFQFGPNSSFNHAASLVTIHMFVFELSRLGSYLCPLLLKWAAAWPKAALSPSS